MPLLTTLSKGDLVTLVIVGLAVSATAPTPLLSDSTCSITIACDPIAHGMTKNIMLMPPFVCVVLQDKVVALKYMPSELMLIDFFMKVQTRMHHGFFISKLSVVDQL
jgi:hypothetical protein